MPEPITAQSERNQARRTAKHPTDKAKIEKLINRLFNAKLRRCLSLHHCILCDEDITLGELYRDRGHDCRVHEECYKAAGAAIKGSA